MFCNINNLMPERKVWSQEEDKILRLLREERGERKWANIARLMQTEFGVCGRTGKQCRERYHNHLDSNIVNSEWSKEEEQILFQMHVQIGNKWSVISQKLPGRTDNCVKNHFYSKLRKAVRRLNKIINDSFPTQFKFIRESVLSKIIKTSESKFKNNSKIDEELADFCDSIKNHLFRLELIDGQDMEDTNFAKKIISDIDTFDKNYKKGYKGMKNEFQYQYKTYLKPPPRTLKKKTSTQSCQSANSDDSSSSFLSSNGSYSSNSISDLSSFQQEMQGEELEKPNGSKSLGATSGRNSSSVSKFENIQEKLRKESLQQRREGLNFHGFKPATFEMQYEDLIMEDSQFYDRDNKMREVGFNELHNNMREVGFNEINIGYDQCPQIGSILAPKEMRDMFAPFYLFGKQQNDNEEIEYKAEMQKMELQ